MRSFGMEIGRVAEKITLFDAADRTYIDERGEQLKAVGWTEGSPEDPLFMQNLKYAIKKFAERFGLGLVVIDSLDSLVLLGRLREPRDEIFKLFEWLRELQVTTIVLGEMPVSHPVVSEGEGYSEDFLVDGIIQLKMEKISDINYRRYIRCVKMRATEHSPDYYILAYDNNSRAFEVAKAMY
jgi:KaiC/GvpD/RAD55 family RecA-like ATPase